jgi:acyl-CoA synthetase (AMP-forming)/AMP-acid ligase II
VRDLALQRAGQVLVGAGADAGGAFLRILDHQALVGLDLEQGLALADDDVGLAAIAQFRPGQRAADAELLAEAANRLARYKLPKVIVPVEQIVRSASGKPDYRWAKAQAAGAKS